jgi:hypothetical protein
MNELAALVRALEELRTVRAENQRLIQDRAANEKANIASRRSICELSDKYKAERDDALRQLKELESQ